MTCPRFEAGKSQSGILGSLSLCPGTTASTNTAPLTAEEESAF